MKNFIFLSPNFPENYWKFCRELKNNGLRVLGIGDCPYDNLHQELKDSLDEYYKVSSLENYDEVAGAVAFSKTNTAKLTGWNPTMSIGWSGMLISAVIFRLLPASTMRIFLASNTNLK